MPIYTFTHSQAIPFETKQALASGVKKIHCEKTGAPAAFVQTAFVRVDRESAFTGGDLNSDYLTLEATIRPGRSEEVETAMLWSLNHLIKDLLKPSKWFISLGRFSTPWLIESGTMLPSA